MCWLQGASHKSMPKLNKKCLSRWKLLNRNINIISRETIPRFVPEYFDIIENSPKRSAPAKTDLLRILLLSKFGGVWADASVYPMLPVSDFYDEVVNDTGFFAYRFFPRGGYRASRKHKGFLDISVWFLCSDYPNHYLINTWKDHFIDIFAKRKPLPHFAFGEVLARLYDSDKKIKHTIDNMVQIDQKIPHSAYKSWKNKKPSFMYKRPNLKN